jgi:hypothetical protein
MLRTNENITKSENDDRFPLRRKTSVFCPYNPLENSKEDTQKEDIPKEEPKKKNIAKKILTKIFGF